eukprot:jgi/Bigna1/64992/fgenesh1_kg.93_\
MDVMNQEIRNNSRTKFYLATDSPETQWKFMEKYGEKITVYKKMEAKRYYRATTLRHAVIDVYLLSLCKAFHGSKGSSYSHLVRICHNQE